MEEGREREGGHKDKERMKGRKGEIKSGQERKKERER